MSRIVEVQACEVLDSRGNPTVSASVLLEDGSEGYAIAPSGASTGEKEAYELRDNDPHRYHGKGVSEAIAHVEGPIKDAILNLDGDEQLVIDNRLIELDGTENKQRLGANAILAVSLAAAKASAISHRLPLYKSIGGTYAHELPMPMMNVINGGAHADNLLDFQEFMIAPISANSFADAVRVGSEVFHTLKKELHKAGHNTNVGDEGGFAPNFSDPEQALDYLVSSIDIAGYIPGKDVVILLDPATSEFYHNGQYVYTGQNRSRSTEEHISYLKKLVENYPILSIEDPVAENDFDGWKIITQELGQKCQLVGDDLFCTNPKILEKGIEEHMANSILIKVNQIGTLSETLQTIEIARNAGYTIVISHRSGETEDTTIADLAVATNSGQIKTGSLSRSDRNAKYNRLIHIEKQLGASARYTIGPKKWVSNLSGN